MRRSLLVFLFLAAGVVHPQIEPMSWHVFWGWLNSLNSGDLAKHEEYLAQHAFHARMHRPFSREAVLEMDLRNRVGGGLTSYRIGATETGVHAILKGRDGKSWAEVNLRFNNWVTAIELHEIDSSQAAAGGSDAADVNRRFDSLDPAEPEQTPPRNGVAAQDAPPRNPGPRLPAPKLLSPDEGAVFDHYPRDTTVRWAPVPGATGYRLEWDYEDSSGWHGNAGLPVAQIAVAETGYTFQFVGKQAGHWRVSAFDESGMIGTPSEWRRFRYLR